MTVGGFVILTRWFLFLTLLYCGKNSTVSISGLTFLSSET